MSKYKRYSEADYRKILQIYEDCGGINETARITKFPSTTVHRIIKQYQTVERFDEEFDKACKLDVLPLLKSPLREHQLMRFHYAYTLGIYLGDGHISKTKSHRAHRIMISLDKAYPKIIKRCKESLGIVFPANEVGIVDKKSFVSVNCYSQQLPHVFRRMEMAKSTNAILS